MPVEVRYVSADLQQAVPAGDGCQELSQQQDDVTKEVDDRRGPPSLTGGMVVLLRMCGWLLNGGNEWGKVDIVSQLGINYVL